MKKAIFFFFSLFFLSAFPALAYDCQFHVTHSGTTADVTFVAPVTDNVRLNLEGMNANCISNSSNQAYNTLDCSSFSGSYGREDMSVITGNTYHTTINYSSLPAQVSPNVIQDHDPFSNICSSQDFTISDVAPTVNPISSTTITQGDTYSASGSFTTNTDPDATSWTATVDYGDGSGTQPLTLSGTNFSLSHVYNTSGVYTETVSVTDNQGATGTQTAIINVLPTSATNRCQFNVTHSGTTAYVTFVAPVTDNIRLNLEGMTNCISNSSSQAYNTLSCAQFGSFGREDMSVITGNTYSTTINYSSLPTQVSPNVIQDHDPFSNICSSQDFTISDVTPTPTPTDTPPVINQLSNQTINEGDTYSANGSFTDGDSTSWTATVDYGDGSGSHALTLSGTNFSLSHVYQDNGTYTLTVNVTDNQGATGTGMATITVNNVAPTVGTITASVNPIQVNTSTTASANFTDPGVLDTHTASWNWGDGNTTTGTVTESNGSGSVSDSHTYTSAGVYPITLTVTDNNGGAGTQTFQYLSVYNPTSQGLFSAGQKYTSPAGAYAANTSLTGNVKFGLSYKYQGTVPTGTRQFSMDFNQANLHFNATSVNSLVISSGIGTLTGTGTVNGSGTYNFLVTGSESANTIRIQIKDSSGNVVYDTQPGAADAATPTIAVTGNVLAH